jgi:protein-L-isoaspartate(D-aspartate) O-methyltransferase
MTENSAGGENVERMEFLLGLRRYGILDAAVLRAMDEVPRHAFVESEHIAQAYADHALPIRCGQTISQPFIVAYMTERLSVKPEHRVLDVGTGSGYQAAVLSRLAREVVGIERYRTLADAARTRLRTLNYANVEIVAGDGMLGVPDKAPFDRILIAAASEDVPQALIEQLGEGGVMILPLGSAGGEQYLVKLTKQGDKVSREQLIGVRFVPLVPGRAREL